MALARALAWKVGSSSGGEGMAAMLGRGSMRMEGEDAAARAKSRSLPGFVVAA